MDKLVPVDERTFKSLLQNFPLPISITRLDDGLIIFTNDLLLKTLELKPEQVENNFALNFYQNQEDRKRVLAALRNGEIVRNFELSLHNSEGSPRWCLISMRKILIGANSTEAILAVFQDITDQKNHESELKKSEKTLRVLADCTPVMMWMDDANRQNVFSNIALREFFGGDVDKIAGKKWMKSIHPDDVEEVEETFSSTFNEREEYQHEYRLMRHDGSYRWVLDQGNPRWGPDGSFQGYIGSLLDITERKITETILRDLVESTGAVTGTAFFQVLVRELAKTLGVKYCFVGELLENKRIRSLAVWEADDFAPAIEYPFEDTPCSEAIEENACIYDEGVRHLFPNDRYLQELGAESYIGAALLDLNENRVGVLAVIDDKPAENPEFSSTILRLFAARAAAELGRKRSLERERRLEAKIQATQKLESLGLLAGGIAHDFNNLLAGIMGNADMAAMALPENSPALEHLSQVTTGVQRAADLCMQLLTYSGGSRIQADFLNLSQLIDEMIRFLGVSLSAGAALNLELDPDLPMVEGDATQIRQVILNLITNARDSLPEGEGMITISTRQESLDPAECRLSFHEPPPERGRYAVLQVEDTGQGMDPKTMEKIFDPFYTTKFEGRGLGLAAVIGIIRSHGGAVKVESTRGTGSSFSVFLPLSDQPEPQAEPPPKIAKKNDHHGSNTVLVADDEASIREIVSKALIMKGYKVRTATNGQEALQLMLDKGEEIDLVLMDRTMPGLKGDEVLEKIRERGMETPVILMSGFIMQDLMEKGKQLGLSGYLQKPFRTRDLLEMVKKTLNE